jgi:phage terminase large subunit GpA-like protein
MSKKVVELMPSDFSETFLYLNGRRFSLTDYPYLRAVYNCSDPRVVLKFSRQTAKSTTLSNIMVTKSIMHPHFKTLYISPSVDQTKVFSHDRVAPVLEQSTFVKKHYLNSTLIQNVFMKQLLNGSRMYLRYAHLNADRVRGYSADMCLFDEVQDQLEDNIPVIEETMSRSLHKFS